MAESIELVREPAKTCRTIPDEDSDMTTRPARITALRTRRLLGAKVDMFDIFRDQAHRPIVNREESC